MDDLCREIDFGVPQLPVDLVSRELIRMEEESAGVGRGDAQKMNMNIEVADAGKKKVTSVGARNAGDSKRIRKRRIPSEAARCDSGLMTDDATIPILHIPQHECSSKADKKRGKKRTTVATLRGAVPEETIISDPAGEFAVKETAKKSKRQCKKSPQLVRKNCCVHARALEQTLKLIDILFKSETDTKHQASDVE